MNVIAKAIKDFLFGNTDRSIDVQTFYISNHDHDLSISEDFKKVLIESFQGGKTANYDLAEMHYYESLENTKPIKKIIDLTGSEIDCQMARIYFASVFFFLQEEPRIKNKMPNRHIIGWFKTVSGTYKAIIAWDQDVTRWNCLVYPA